MDKVCVLIRVYNRLEDLKHAVDIIRDTWTNGSYYLLVVSNGKQKGYTVGNDIKAKIDHLVELETNAGHLLGNSQLLLSGLEHIPDYCPYTVILEADTWMYGDKVITRYIQKLTAQNMVWASARWFDKLYSVATDIAIVQTAFIKNHPGLWSFTVYPEYYIAEYLINNNLGYTFITENMPVHVPSYIKRKYPLSNSEGRFNVFPDSKMVTHHIEDLPGGMARKKYLFNAVAGKTYFKMENSGGYAWQRLKIKLAIALSYLLPRRNWFFKYRKINEADLEYQRRQAEDIARKKNTAAI